MAKLIETLEDAVQLVAPEYSQVHFIPRSTPRNVDKYLSGIVRHARRIGEFPNIQPQNAVSLSQDLTQHQNVIPLNRLVSGIAPGSLVRIGGQEILKISDVSTQDTIIITEQKTLVAYTSGTQVELFGEPVRTLGYRETEFSLLTSTIPVGTSLRIQIQSKFRIVTGDQIYIQRDDLILGGTSFTVTAARQLSETSTLFNVEVDLDDGTPTELISNSIVYLRAFPSYYSAVNRLPVPYRSNEPLGPFCIDYVSGRFNDLDDVEEALDVQFFDSNDLPLSTYPVHASKNYPVIACPIPASSFLFCDVIRGSINYKQNKFVLTCDDRGKARIKLDLVPGWSGEQSWTTRCIGLTSGSSVVRYRFLPDEQQIAGVCSFNQPSTMTFNLNAVEQASTALEIVLVGAPFASCEWVIWSPVGPSVSKIQHTLTGRVVGNNDWQAGSLLIKPYFNTLSDIRALFDFDSFNNGAVHF